MTSPPLAHPRAALPCIALVLLLAACARKEGPGTAGGPPPLPVTAVRVHVQNVPIALEAVGQAEGSRAVEIRARVNGILQKRVDDEGAAVKAGAVLFAIDPEPYELAVRDARAALQQERVRRDLAHPTPSVSSPWPAKRRSRSASSTRRSPRKSSRRRRSPRRRPSSTRPS